MKPFVVVLRQANSAVVERIAEAYGPESRLRFSATVHFVADADTVVSADVATKVGLKGGDRIQGASGVVLRVTGYSGWTTKMLWEWFSDVADTG